MNLNNPQDPKVPAAAAGAGAGAIVSTFLVWLLDLAFWNGDAAPDVPLPVVAMVGLVVTAGMAWAAGYVKRTPLSTLVARTRANDPLGTVQISKVPGPPAG